MPTTEIQLLDSDRISADIFFYQKPVVTDWDTVRKAVQAGLITSESALLAIKYRFENVEHDVHSHDHWIAQQSLRLALLHEAGKQLESRLMCESCGSRKADPLFHDPDECLNCRESNKQYDRLGWEYYGYSVHVRYDHRSNSWGLLCKWRADGNTFVFWYVIGYATENEGWESLLPIARYNAWQHNKTNGLGHQINFNELLPIEKIMLMPFPITPAQFCEHLRTAINEDMKHERNLVSGDVREALKEHKYKEKD
jgi:hypothetical protein